jgi:type IV secretory pathway TrbF-like protein
MTDPNTPDTPLTPEARAIMARARQSFLVSIGILIVGLIAIGGVIVYKSMQSSGSATPVVVSGAGDYALAAVKVPSGAQVISAVAADGKVTVSYKAGAVTSIRIYDGKTGEMIREVPVVSE